jgi:hypothetical protein
MSAAGIAIGKKAGAAAASLSGTSVGTTGIFLDISQVQKRLAVLAARYPLLAERALNIEGNIEMTEAKERTPVDTGALRASGRAHSPERKGFAQSVQQRLTFGGPAVQYALTVHEDMGAFHAVGQSKFLESVILESKPFMAARVSKTMLAEIKAR